MKRRCLVLLLARSVPLPSKLSYLLKEGKHNTGQYATLVHISLGKVAFLGLIGWMNDRNAKFLMIQEYVRWEHLRGRGQQKRIV